MIDDYDHETGAYIVERRRLHSEFRDSYWTTKDGHQARICDMDDAHVFNAYMRSGDQRLFQEMVIRLFKEKT
jgi:hypothetical protein